MNCIILCTGCDVDVDRSQKLICAAIKELLVKHSKVITVKVEFQRYEEI